MIYSSLPTVEQVNALKLFETIKTLDPELWLFKQASMEFGISPMLAAKIYRSLGLITRGSRYGKVSIVIKDNQINAIIGEEHVRVSEEINTEENIYLDGLSISVSTKTTTERKA